MATTKNQQEPEHDPETGVVADEEGARSFSRFMATLSRGEAEMELSEELHQLTTVLQAEVKARGLKCKGTLAVKITLVADVNGAVAIGYTYDRKEPKRTTTPDVAWISKGGNLIDSDPRQTRLPLREVADRKRTAREPAAPTTREV